VDTAASSEDRSRTGLGRFEATTREEGIGVVTRIRKLGALALAMPLAMGFTMLVAPLNAEAAAAAGITSPSSGAVISHGSSVTVTATATLLGGGLVVYPPVGASVNLGVGGPYAKLSGKVAIDHNGPYKIELQGLGGSTRIFYVKVPPAAPGGLSATVSGKKLTVRWNLGLEHELTGYNVSVAGQSRSTGTSCPGSTCSTSFTLPSTATGSVKVGVQARRSTGTGGTVVSGTSHTSVTLGGGKSDGAAAAPNVPGYTTPGGNDSALSPVNLNPTAATDGSSSGFAYPTPQPEVATANQLMSEAKPVAEVSQMAWGRSLALALILLVCAAHLGTWTRRLRFAQSSVGAGGRLRRKAGGKARVRTAHERIAQAEALAKTGTLTKADILGKAAVANAKPPKAARIGMGADEQPKVRSKGSKGMPMARATGSGDPEVARAESKEVSTQSKDTTTRSKKETGMPDLVGSKVGDPDAKDPAEKALTVLNSPVNRTDLRTLPVSATPTIAESSARSTRAVPPIQPLDRAATTTRPLTEIAENGTAAGTSGTRDQGGKTSQSPLGGRRRTT
jgi:hypothetical protein